MGTPNVFTKTPVEGVYRTMGVEVQEALSALITGNPVFLGALFVLLMWRALGLGVRLGLSEVRASRAALEMFKAFSLIILAWSMLTPGHSMIVGPIDAPTRDIAWEELPGVNNAVGYKELHNEATPAWGYQIVDEAIEELTTMLHDAVRRNEKHFDPADQILGLMSLQASSLGATHADVATTFNQLVAECVDRDTAKILERGARAQDLFDMSTAHCRSRWSDFEQATGNAKSAMLDDFNDKYVESMVPSVDKMEMAVEMMEKMGVHDNADSFVMNVLIENYIGEQAGRFGANSRRYDEATFSDTEDIAHQTWQSGVFGESLMALVDLIPFLEDAHTKAAKAEAANRFNETLDMIPVMRGWMHLLFAVTFPFAMLAVAGGWMQPFWAWLSGRFMLGLYSPAAAMLYQMTSRITELSRISSDPRLSWVTSDELVLGGSVLLQAEIDRVQTAYMSIEIAVCGAFLLGSFSLLKGGISVGHGMASRIERGAASAYGAVRGASSVAKGAATVARGAGAVVTGGVTGAAMGVLSSVRPPSRPHTPAAGAGFPTGRAGGALPGPAGSTVTVRSGPQGGRVFFSHPGSDNPLARSPGRSSKLDVIDHKDVP